MIDEVLVLTLNKSRRRRDLFVGGMKARGTPVDKIHFVRAKDANDFDKDFSKIAKAAKADGFEYVKYFQGHGDTGVIHQTPAQMAQLWDYVWMLRYITTSGKTCLITWDDRVISVPWKLLDNMVDDLSSIDDFFLFQLRLRGPEEYLNLPKEDFYARRYHYLKLFKAFTDLTEDLQYTEVFATPGLAGYDETIVFSPDGAQWMLDELDKLKDTDAELKKNAYRDIPMPLKVEYCKTINLDNYICWALRKASEKQLKKKKGIYRPRYPGFDFVDDPIPLGSLTGWATRTIENYETANENTENQFLER